MDLNVAVTNHNPLGDGFYDLALLFGGQLRPAGVEITGFGDDLLLGEVRDLENIEFRLELG